MIQPDRLDEPLSVLGCHCLCPMTHPDREGICLARHDVTAAVSTRLLGTVDVPLCHPCAAAQLGVPAGTVIQGKLAEDDGPAGELPAADGSTTDEGEPP